MKVCNDRFFRYFSHSNTIMLSLHTENGQHPIIVSAGSKNNLCIPAQTTFWLNFSVEKNITHSQTFLPTFVSILTCSDRTTKFKLYVLMCSQWYYIFTCIIHPGRQKNKWMNRFHSCDRTTKREVNLICLLPSLFTVVTVQRSSKFNVQGTIFKRILWF
jgi:hypothetical protein